MNQESLRGDLTPEKASQLRLNYLAAGFCVPDQLDSHGITHVLYGDLPVAYILPSKAALLESNAPSGIKEKIKKIALEV